MDPTFLVKKRDDEKDTKGTKEKISLMKNLLLVPTESKKPSSLENLQEKNEAKEEVTKPAQAITVSKEVEEVVHMEEKLPEEKVAEKTETTHEETEKEGTELVDYSLSYIKKDDLNFYLFKHTDPDFKLDLLEESEEYLYVNKNIPSKIFVHGWTGSSEAFWYEKLKSAYFSTKQPLNVIYVDWKKPANYTYSVSAANSKATGELIADFLIGQHFILEKVHLIGHALGAHVAGFVGKTLFNKTGGKPGRITALDPCSEQFEHEQVTEDLRLCRDDATFVDIIHTDIGGVGFASKLGDVDFYPNYGSDQPGCLPREFDAYGSNRRAVAYFIESVTMEKCVAKEAALVKEGNGFNLQVMERGQQVVFGENCNRSAKGVFFFETNKEEPYLRGKS